LTKNLGVVFTYLEPCFESSNIVVFRLVWCRFYQKGETARIERFQIQNLTLVGQMPLLLTPKLRAFLSYR